MIEITFPQQELVATPVTDAYSYRADKPLRWLQRLCLRILDRLGCQYYHNMVTYKTARGEVDTLLDAIRDQVLAIDYTYARKCEYILIGRDKMRELWGEVVDYPLAIDVPATSHAREVLGMKLITVPWFEGIVCLPDLERL
jgi:hypothetical protein